MSPEEWVETRYAREVAKDRSARKAAIAADEEFERWYAEHYDYLTELIVPQLTAATSEPIAVTRRILDGHRDAIPTWLRRNGWFVVDSSDYGEYRVYVSNEHYVDHMLKGFWSDPFSWVFLFMFGISLMAYLDRRSNYRNTESAGRPPLEERR